MFKNEGGAGCSEEDALRSSGRFASTKNDGEEIVMKYLSLENKFCKLQEDNSKTLVEEKKLKK